MKSSNAEIRRHEGCGQYFFLTTGITASQESITMTERQPVIMQEPEVSIVSVAVATCHSKFVVKKVDHFS